MSNFTPLVTRTYEFEGDTITVKFSRLKRKHMLNAMPALSNLNAAEDEVAKNVALNEFLNDVIDVIPEYVKEFNGLNDSEGNAISIETVIDDFYFLKLAAEMSMDMVKESAPLMEGNV